MINDLILIFSWWLIIFVIGLIFFPITTKLFNQFLDKGYALSKIIGILTISFIIWLLASLKLLPFTQVNLWLIFFLSAAVNLYLWKKERKRPSLKQNWHYFLLEEALFLLVLSFWGITRGFQPDIQGLEKYMDFGFVNSILRSRFFPPLDMWFAGDSINYYYFGHLISATLIKLSGFSPSTAYNLLIATIASLTFTASFSLAASLISYPGHNKKLAVFGGVFTALLVTFGGNLQILYYRFSQGHFTDYWYPDATRFIVEKFGALDNTIHEFPLYSFVVADLHGHMINLPNVLLILATIWEISLKINKRNQKPLYFQLLFLAFLLAIAMMTNMWDYPIYLMVSGLVILFANLRVNKTSQALTKTFLSGTIIVFASLVFSLPFHLHFKDIAEGVALTDFHTPLWMLGVLWGEFLFFTLAFLVLIIVKRFSKRSLEKNDYFVLSLFGVSWLLIVLPEFIYVKDIYIHSYQRANTMFKLTYQAFLMFSLAGGYTFTRYAVANFRKILKAPFYLTCLLFLPFVFLYSFYALRSNYGFKNYRGLDGLVYLSKSYPGDYQAINWLNENVTGQPGIVEAVGESYTDFARISANTGLPTILGWRVHEWLWRGSFDEPGKRTEEVKEIYEGNDLAKTQSLINKYQIKYLILGKLELQQYPQIKEEKIKKLGKVVFISEETKIYQF